LPLAAWKSLLREGIKTIDQLKAGADRLEQFGWDRAAGGPSDPRRTRPYIGTQKANIGQSLGSELRSPRWHLWNQSAPYLSLFRVNCSRAMVGLVASISQEFHRRLPMNRLSHRIRMPSEKPYFQTR
jgi:hypothetical protein